MVKLKEGKLKYAFKQKEKGVKNKYLASLVGVRIRRFQQLYAQFKMTGEISKLKKERRPKTELTDEEKNLINKVVKESKLNGAVKIRLYIEKYYNKKLPYGKIHNYLLSHGISKPDKKKQKQRKYCRYERKHSFSFGHVDWHESKVVEGKWVTAWEDDASRKILAGGEFNNATTENAIKVVKKAMQVAWEEYSALLLALNTDKGSQFYANKKDNEGEKGLAKFEIFLKKEGIKHITSRRNHPQTNGKEERWFRTYNEKRKEFNSFEDFIKWYNNTIHLGLNRKKGVTPNEAILHKLRPGSLLGLFLRRFD
jgi:putative transposase